jgi:hypothetical protein
MAFPPRVHRPRHEAEYTPPSVAEVKKMWNGNTPSLSLYVITACIGTVVPSTLHVIMWLDQWTTLLSIREWFATDSIDLCLWVTLKQLFSWLMSLWVIEWVTLRLSLFLGSYIASCFNDIRNRVTVVTVGLGLWLCYTHCDCVILIVIVLYSLLLCYTHCDCVILIFMITVWKVRGLMHAFSSHPVV